MNESLQGTNNNEGYMVLRAKGIVKEFSGVRVLNNVDFDLARGEVHALLGENGAGKSTLVKILTGVYTKTSGTIMVNESEVDFKSRNDADSQGIGIVFQEFSQVPQLSVAENLFLGRSILKRKLGGLIRVLDWKEMRKITKQALDEFDVHVDPNTPVKKLGVAKQQIIEIIKALMGDAKILIMDEPTASLSKGEIDHLFKIIDGLKKKGVSIIYISHRLEEIKKICDRATIIRDGTKVATINLKESSIDDIIKMMVGRELKDIYPPKRNTFGSVILKLEKVSSKGKFNDVSFEVRSGEVIGITGLVGAGKTEISSAIFGIDKDYSGSIYLNGKRTFINSPLIAKKLGIALIPEDRKRQGVILKLKASDNIGLPNLSQYKNKLNYIDIKKERESILKNFKNVDIRPQEPQKLAQLFSGGNQQKIVISKWLSTNARLYIFDEPTRGVDVGAKAEIYKLISSLTEAGCGVIICSSEIQEIVGISNKIIVMNRGNVSAILDGNEFNTQDIVKAQIGEVEKHEN